MAHKAYQHQKRAQRYIRKHPHPSLFMAMRTGKTLPAIREAEKTQPRTKRLGLRVLVVAPNSALGGWADELDNEGIDRYTFLEGTRQQRLEALMSGARYNLINTEGWLSIPEIASEDWVAWDHVIIDESTRIKNPKARITKFFLYNSTLRNVPHRWALTGTPNPEGDLDFYCQLAWLNSRAFGCKSFWEFRAKYFEPDMFNWYPTPDGEQVITQYLAEHCFILKKKEGKFRAKTVREKRYCKLPKNMRRTYLKVEDAFVLELDGDEVDRTVYAGQKWLWLRQLCGGFVAGEFVWQGKYNELKNLVTRELARETIIVWFQFTQELRQVTKLLRAEGIAVQYMCGEHKPSERRAMKEAFQRGDVQVWCIQQAVGDMGLDLSLADTQIFYSCSKSLRMRQQCQERLTNLKRKTPILTIDLLVENSSDEDVVESLNDKRWTSQAAINKAIRTQLKARIR